MYLMGRRIENRYYINNVTLFTICKREVGVAITGIERESSQYLTDSTIISLKTYTFA